MPMTDLADVIPENNIIILAPHYDDVVLTFGGYLDALFKSGRLAKKFIRVVHIFSRSNYQARDHDGNRDTSLPRVQFATGVRLLEDLECLDALIGHGHYNYELKAERECVVRLKAWKPGEKMEFPQGNLSTFDEEEQRIFTQLKKYAREWLAHANTAVLVPLGVKEHVDHVMLRDAVFATRHILLGKAKAALYLGEDQPYTGLASEEDWRVAKTFMAQHRLEALTYEIDAMRKARLVEKHYPSQYEVIYRDGVLHRADELAKEMKEPVPLERMYRIL